MIGGRKKIPKQQKSPPPPPKKSPGTGVCVLWDLDGREKDIVHELCDSGGGRPGLSALTSLMVSVDVKLYCS